MIIKKTFFLSVLILLFRGRVSQGQAVLLVGLSDSGKTLLFSRVRKVLKWATEFFL